MEEKEINSIVKNMPREELEDNLAYLVREMEDHKQKEFLGVD